MVEWLPRDSPHLALGAEPFLFGRVCEEDDRASGADGPVTTGRNDGRAIAMGGAVSRIVTVGEVERIAVSAPSSLDEVSAMYPDIVRISLGVTTVEPARDENRLVARPRSRPAARGRTSVTVRATSRRHASCPGICPGSEAWW